MKGIKKYISLYLDECKTVGTRREAEDLLYTLGLDIAQIDRVFTKFWNSENFGTAAASYILLTEGYKEVINKEKVKFRVIFTRV